MSIYSVEMTVEMPDGETVVMAMDLSEDDYIALMKLGAVEETVSTAPSTQKTICVKETAVV